MKPRAASAGFTLVEVLVAMAIFALLVSVLYGALSSVTRAFDAAEQSVDDGARLRIGSEFLTRLIETAYPLALGNGREWLAQFSGDAEVLRFMADMPGYVGVSGVHEVVLRVREVDGETGLWFAWRPMMLGRDGKRVVGDFQERVLVPGVASMRLRYFGAESDEQQPSWSEAWSEMPRMPALVEVRLEDEGDRAWPVLSVRPRASSLRYLSVREGGAESRSEDDDAPQAPDAPVEGRGRAVQ